MTYIKRRNELLQNIINEELSLSEARQCLAGFLMKSWEAEGHPVLASAKQTYPENAMMNAEASLSTETVNVFIQTAA